jgi:hypothetical protein
VNTVGCRVQVATVWRKAAPVEFVGDTEKLIAGRDIANLFPFWRLRQVTTIDTPDSNYELSKNHSNFFSFLFFASII